MMESSISISTSSIANQHEQGLTTATAAASITKDNSNTNNVASCTPSNNAKPKASPKKKSKKDNTEYFAQYYQKNQERLKLKQKQRYQRKKDEDNKKKLAIAETIRNTGKNYVYIEESQKYKEEIMGKQQQQKEQDEKVVLQPKSPIRSFSIHNVLKIAPDLEAPVRRILHRQMMEELVITVDAKKGNSDRLNTEFPSALVHYRGAPTGTSNETSTYEERFAYATETARGTKGICKT